MTGEATTDTSGLTLLGHGAALPANPEAARLERVPNPHPGYRYCVRFTAPEFTSLCPMTGQPDFAHLVIDYVPADWLVEELSPVWLRIGGYWYPRGGIPIDVFWQSGAAPEGVWVPEQGVPPYRGRG